MILASHTPSWTHAPWSSSGPAAEISKQQQDSRDFKVVLASSSALWSIKTTVGLLLPAVEAPLVYNNLLGSENPICPINYWLCYQHFFVHIKFSTCLTSSVKSFFNKRLLEFWRVSNETIEMDKGENTRLRGRRATDYSFEMLGCITKPASHVVSGNHSQNHGSQSFLTRRGAHVSCNCVSHGLTIHISSNLLKYNVLTIFREVQTLCLASHPPPVSLCIIGTCIWLSINGLK